MRLTDSHTLDAEIKKLKEELIKLRAENKALKIWNELSKNELNKLRNEGTKSD